nr:dihydroxyacetone kinase subunit DhaL [Pectinatus sottacetonis]
MASIREAVRVVSKAVIAKKILLTDLDQAIGDGDHGINMARGFESVLKKIDLLEENTDAALILKTVGMGLISSVGGAAGPLYGTAFLRASAVCKNKSEIDLATAQAMLDAAIKGIQDRGKAQKGEKTMLDALIPASEAFSAGTKNKKNILQCLNDAVKAAQKGVEYTKTIIATKGRASYLAERSIGHEDPGAVSSAIMLEALYNYLK